MHGELALLAETGGTILAGEPFLDVGMDSNIMTSEIVPTDEFFRASRADKPPLALMLDGLVLCQGISAGEALSACRVVAGEAAGTVQGMDLCYMALELATAAKGTGAGWAGKLGWAASGANDDGQEVERIVGVWRGTTTANGMSRAVQSAARRYRAVG